jgi:HSP20 family molecular chaperone IbpA
MTRFIANFDAYIYAAEHEVIPLYTIMSIARQLLHEVRPFFRMLEEPFGRSAVAPIYQQRSLFEDPFFRSPAAIHPPVDVTEEGDKYIIEAELPGVKKENVDIRIGDAGRSVTIQGKTSSRQTNGESDTTAETTDDEGQRIFSTDPTILMHPLIMTQVPKLWQRASQAPSLRWSVNIQAVRPSSAPSGCLVPLTALKCLQSSRTAYLP